MDDRGKGRLAAAERRDDNSPAFQCRDKSVKIQVPPGRLKNTALHTTTGICENEIQPSLRDWRPCARTPGVETPGYCQVVPLGRMTADGVLKKAGKLLPIR